MINSTDSARTPEKGNIPLMESCALPPPPPGYTSSWPRISEASILETFPSNFSDRVHQLTPAAAHAWLALLQASAASGIQLTLLSGFRSVARQRQIVIRKLSAGASLSDILQVNAYPGFSEHHSGCAVDIGTADCPDLDESFEHSPAFDWLCSCAPPSGFTLSYPRGNTLGVVYEPWHWMFRPACRRVDTKTPPELTGGA